jgi:peptide deformylase
VIDEGLIAESAGASVVSEAGSEFAVPSDASTGTEFAQRVRAFINPRLIEESRDETEMEEGCLSIPGINETVMRKRQIRVRYQDLQGGEHEESCSNLLARVLQHEMDHLNGVFFIDRIGSVRRKLLTKKLKTIAEEAQQEVLGRQKKNVPIVNSPRAESNL